MQPATRVLYDRTERNTRRKQDRSILTILPDDIVRNVVQHGSAFLRKTSSGSGLQLEQFDQNIITLAHELDRIACRDFLRDPGHDPLAEIGVYRNTLEIAPDPFRCLPERLGEQRADSFRTTRKMQVEEGSEQRPAQAGAV